MTLQFMHVRDMAAHGSGLEYFSLVAWQKVAPAAAVHTHIGSGADILAPRQLYSPGWIAVNNNYNHYHNSANIHRRLYPHITCNAANTAAPLF